MKWSNIELKRGIDVDKDLWEWRKTVDSRARTAARTDGTISCSTTTGAPVATYNFTQAWPSSTRARP